MHGICINPMELAYFIVSTLANLSFSGIFLARLKGKSEVENKIGIFFQLLVIPMAFLLYVFINKNYPTWIIAYVIIYIA